VIPPLPHDAVVGKSLIDYYKEKAVIAVTQPVLYGRDKSGENAESVTASHFYSCTVLACSAFLVCWNWVSGDRQACTQGVSPDPASIELNASRAKPQKKKKNVQAQYQTGC
jgi:hypothetical protein